MEFYFVIQLLLISPVGDFCLPCSLSIHKKKVKLFVKFYIRVPIRPQFIKVMCRCWTNFNKHDRRNKLRALDERRFSRNRRRTSSREVHCSSAGCSDDCISFARSTSRSAVMLHERSRNRSLIQQWGNRALTNRYQRVQFRYTTFYNINITVNFNEHVSLTVDTSALNTNMVILMDTNYHNDRIDNSAGIPCLPLQ